MKPHQSTEGRKAPYQDLIEHFVPQLEKVVAVEYRKVTREGMDDFYVEGELLEIKPTGICVEQVNHPDGEVFVHFNHIRAFDNFQRKCMDADFKWIAGDYDSFAASH